jgi:hypothetical protein
MPITIPGAFLIIARYNRDKWNNLTDLQQDTAHETAEKLFPEKRHPLPQLRPAERAILQELPAAELRPFHPLTLEEQKVERLEHREAVSFQALPTNEEDPHAFKALLTEEPDPFPKGVRLLHSFHTGAFAEIDGKIMGEKLPAHVKVELFRTDDKDEQRLLVDSLLTAPGTDTKDPGMGWIAVVDYSSYEKFVEALGGKKGPLWRMYDIEVIPLNNDRTTQDVYDFMTPVSWAK